MPQFLIVIIGEPRLDLQEDENCLDRAGQTLADLHDLGSVLLDAHCHLYDLIVGVIQ